MMLDLCVVGGFGRMGKIIALLAEADPEVRIGSVWETQYAIEQGGSYAQVTAYSKNPVKVVADGKEAVEVCDVVLDFSLPQAFTEIVRVCEGLSKPLVTGTTGIENKDALLGPLARKVAVVSAANMSVGINSLLRLCEGLAADLGQVSDIEIVEAHHRTKKDVPSGTALEMARLIGGRAGKRVVLGRNGATGPRADELVIHSLRVGDVPGTHTVMFSLKGETLEVTHTAQSRECFAVGALRAARFVAKAKPGLYSMLDVLASR